MRARPRRRRPPRPLVVCESGEGRKVGDGRDEYAGADLRRSGRTIHVHDDHGIIRSVVEINAGAAPGVTEATPSQMSMSMRQSEIVSEADTGETPAAAACAHGPAVARRRRLMGSRQEGTAGQEDKGTCEVASALKVTSFGMPPSYIG